MFLSENRTMFIVMSLFGNEGMGPKDIPQTKEEVRKIMHTPNQTTFLEIYGYVSLDPKGWSEKNDMYDFKSLKREMTEPYYVAHRDVQMYDETYTTWGFNKVTQVFDMNATKYKMKVLPDLFMIHLNHASIKGFRYWRKGYKYDKRHNLKVGTSVERWRNLPGLITNAYYPPLFSPKAQDIVSCSANVAEDVVFAGLQDRINSKRAKVKSFKAYLLFLVLILVPLTAVMLKGIFC